MASQTFQPPSRKSLTLSLTWFMAAGLCALTIENVWLDPWLRANFPDFPSLVPEPPSPLWLLTFAAVGIVCVVLMVGQILLVHRAGVSRNAKIIAGLTVAAAVCLSVIWFLVTSGITHAPRLLS
jgi:hypothetical protein